MCLGVIARGGELYPCTDKKEKIVNTQHLQGGNECDGAKLRSG